MGEHVAGLDQQHARERHRESPVDDQHASMSWLRMLGHDRCADHRAVVGNDACMVGHQQRAAVGRHVANSFDLDPPVLVIEPERDSLDPSSELRVIAEFVAFTLQLIAGAHRTKRPHRVRLWQHAVGLDMPRDLQAAATEYLGWLQLEANRSPNTVRAYESELRKLIVFLKANDHSLLIDQLRHDDLRAYQRHLAAPPRQTAHEKRDRALVQFLISTGCRISEALALDRTDFPRSGNRLVVTGKGSKQRSVYLTVDARAALEDYLGTREDASMALFVNFDRAAPDDRARRLTAAGARFIVRKLRVQLGAWSFKSPHVARHTAATTLLEVTGGDVRLVQEVLGHANLNTLQGYTKIVDSRKQDAYRRYQEFLDDKKAGR